MMFKYSRSSLFSDPPSLIPQMRSPSLFPSLLIWSCVLLISLPLFARPKRGIQGKMAPDWHVNKWFQLPNSDHPPEIKQYQGKVLVLFFFQSWCPGCHSRGFPTIQSLKVRFAQDDRVKFLAIQTVFEGFSSNTASKALSSAQSFQLKIPIGHDDGGGRRSITMGRYRSGGTPWIVIIDPRGKVRYNHFHLNLAKGIKLIQSLL